MHLSRCAVVAAVLAVSSSLAHADPVAVRFTEGVMRGFPVLRSVSGETLAHGEMIQIPRGDRIENRMIFRYADGSYYEERVVYSQKDVFTLQSYRVIQRGPSFPATLDAFVDRETGRYEVVHRGERETTDDVLQGRIDLPPDTYNGLLLTLMKNMRAGA